MMWWLIDAMQPPKKKKYAGGMSEAEAAETYRLAYGDPPGVNDDDGFGYKNG